MSRGIYFKNRTIGNDLQYYITHEGYDSCKQLEAIVRAELGYHKQTVCRRKQASSTRFPIPLTEIVFRRGDPTKQR